MSELKLIIRKSEFNGTAINAPPSKSYTHRAVMAAALCRSVTEIENPLISDDTVATINAMRQFGAKIEYGETSIRVDGSENRIFRGSGGQLVVNCSESGTTLRLLSSISALLPNKVTLTGKEGLMRRPTKDIVDALRGVGISISDDHGHGPVELHGGMKGLGKRLIRIRGDTSSQFISGLLIALPLAKGSNTVEIIGNIQSLPYIRMTLDVLKAFGIIVDASDDYRRYVVPGGQSYRSPGTYSVEGDYSSAAFVLAGAALAGKSIVVKGLRKDSLQADSEIVHILDKMGADMKVGGEDIEVGKSKLRGVDVDAGDCPDLVPILSVIASQAKGITRITNVGRLRIKESDRLGAMITELGKMGAIIRSRKIAGKEILEIRGPAKLGGAIIDVHNDHRIAMSCAIAGLISNGQTVIQNPEVVKKSYPDFFYHMRTIGATVLSETPSIGSRFRITAYGGSHEKVIGVKISGLKVGTEISLAQIESDLGRRRPFGLLTTQRRESDKIKIVAGIDNGRVSGSDVVFEIENRDVDSRPYESMRFTPRPNHGDYTTYVKYGGVFDFRGGGFLSARMTACTVIAGSIARQILEREGIRIFAYVKQVGKAKMERMPSEAEALENTYKSEVRCPDLSVSKAMKSEIEDARSKKDSVGGVVECQANGLPVGLGEPIFDAIDSVVSHYLFSIPAVKGVEFGSGFASAAKRGSENNDLFEFGRDGESVVTRTNNSGGVQGGITNGMPMVVRVAIKPTSSIAVEQDTINVKTHRPSKISVIGRHDPCVAIRAPVIVETTVAMALLDLFMRK